MKKFIMGFIVGALMMVTSAAFASGTIQKIQVSLNPNIKINVNGEAIALEDTPIIREGKTYLPLREIGEKVMDMNVDWDGDTQTVIMTSNDAWPINDVSGDKVETNNDIDFGYDYHKLFERIDTPIDELDYKFFVDKVNRVRGFIKNNEKMIADYEEDNTRFPSYLIERLQEEIPKLEAILPYWEDLLNQKDAQLEEEYMKRIEEERSKTLD